MKKDSSLTFSVMLFLGCFLFFTKPLESKPMVYDCFLFLNEFDVLDIRLHEMATVVDKFVIVECTETFRGNPKPLNFPDQASRFAEFTDKIIYVVIDEHFPTDNPWQREFFQRNQIMRGLKDCKDEDIIFVSDVDEIVENQGVLFISSALEHGSHQFAGVEHRYHSNFLNSVPGGPWHGTVATTYALAKKHLPQGLRAMKGSVPILAKGWHFTWQGGFESHLYKIQSFSHSEIDTPADHEAARIGAENRHLCPVIAIDDSFPQYIRNNLEYFESIQFIRIPNKKDSE